jgi:hypothetical protein
MRYSLSVAGEHGDEILAFFRNVFWYGAFILLSLMLVCFICCEM